MAKTNWQDPRTGEIISPHISGLQEAVGKLEESIGIDSVVETDIPLTEVFISNDDRCRIYQADEGKRNWLLSPTPSIKKNGVIITDDFEIDYGGGAVVLTTPILETDVLTADATYTVKIVGKQLSTEDYTTEEKNKLANIEENADKTTKENVITAIGYTPIKSVNGQTGEDITIATGSDIEIVNNLTETIEGKALDATQGKALNDNKMDKSGGEFTGRIYLRGYSESYTDSMFSGNVALPVQLTSIRFFTVTNNLNLQLTGGDLVQGNSCTLIISQESIAYPITFGSTIFWQNGEIPDMSTPNKRYVLTFMRLKTPDHWLGMFGGSFDVS